MAQTLDNHPAGKEKMAVEGYFADGCFYSDESEAPEVKKWGHQRNPMPSPQELNMTIRATDHDDTTAAPK